MVMCFVIIQKVGICYFHCFGVLIFNTEETLLLTCDCHFILYTSVYLFNIFVKNVYGIPVSVMGKSEIISCCHFAHH